MRTLLTIIVACSSLISSSQDFSRTAKRYKDKFTFERMPGEEVIRTWFHYVVTSTSEGNWVVRTFYPETGQLTHLTTYADEGCTVRSGISTYWYDDGTLVHTGAFDRYGRAGVWIEGADSGAYVNNVRQGPWRFGREGKRNTWVRGAYVSGKREGKWITRDSLDREILVRTFKEDMLHGEWTRTDPVTGEGTRRVYHMDALLEGELDPIAYEERMPCFKECADLDEPAARASCTEAKVMQFLSKELVYPDEARKMDVSGRALFSFVVNADGTISDIQARTGLCKDIEEVCRHALSRMPTWVPGTQNGKAVKVQYEQPVKFTLR